MENIVFVQAALEHLPPELAGQADRITINFPWGSLLNALVVPEPVALSAIAGIGRAGASLTLLVNMSVFDDAAYCRRHGLCHPPVFADPKRTRRLFGAAGLAVVGIDADVPGLPYRTTWGQKLTKSGRRRVLRLDAVVASR